MFFGNHLKVLTAGQLVFTIVTSFIELNAADKPVPVSDGIGSTKRPEEQIALHEKILKEYLERMNETTEADKSINWVTHQKCKDMFILSKVSQKHTCFFIQLNQGWDNTSEHSWLMSNT